MNGNLKKASNMIIKNKDICSCSYFYYNGKCKVIIGIHYNYNQIIIADFMTRFNFKMFIYLFSPLQF